MGEDWGEGWLHEGQKARGQAYFIYNGVGRIIKKLFYYTGLTSAMSQVGTHTLIPPYVSMQRVERHAHLRMTEYNLNII